MPLLVAVRLTALAVVLASALLATRANAAPAKPAEDAETTLAREHVNKAKVHFKVGEFDAAIAEWKEAYKIKSVPSLLFNIGQAYRLAENYKQSKFYYKNYLADLPTAPNRDEVERQLAQLDQLLADAPAAAKPIVDPSPVVVTKPPEPPPAVVTKPVDVPKPVEPPKPPPVVVTKPVEPPKPPPAVVTKPVEPPKPPPVVVTKPVEPPPPPAVVESKPAELPKDVFEPPPSIDGDDEGLKMAPLALAAATAVLAVAGGVTYGLARGDWGDAVATERPRAETDALIASGDTKWKAAMGLAGAAALTGIGAGVLFAF